MVPASPKTGDDLDFEKGSLIYPFYLYFPNYIYLSHKKITNGSQIETAGASIKKKEEVVLDGAMGKGVEGKISGLPWEYLEGSMGGGIGPESRPRVCPSPSKDFFRDKELG